MNFKGEIQAKNVNEGAQEVEGRRGEGELSFLKSSG
jgi:hypothetical protein